MLLVFIVFERSSLYTDSKGNNEIIDVKKICHVQKIAPSLRKKGNILLVLDTLVLFQMAFKTQEMHFQTT